MAAAKKGAVKRSGKQDAAPASGSRRMVAIFVLGPILAFLAMVLPRPGELHYGFERVHGDTEHSAEIQHQVYTRKNVWFTSGDANNTMLSAWEYQPFDGFLQYAGKAPPIVIMAHGLGGQRDFGLHKTADVFARAGIAVLVFDYRTFGGSDGEPRHWVDPYRQLDDWRAAIGYVKDSSRNHKWDASRLVLWGTSYGGGHVIRLAAELQSTISGVVAMVPHLSGPAAAKVSISRRGVLPSLRLLVASMYDVLRAKLGLSPVYVRLTGPLNTLSVMALDEGELNSYFAKHPDVKLGGWQNMIQARFLQHAGTYSPLDTVESITAPLLVVAAIEDRLCPYAVIDQMARKLGIDVLGYSVDHFALYLNEVWAHSVTQMLSFVCSVTNTVCPRDKNAEYLKLNSAVIQQAGVGMAAGGDAAGGSDTSQGAQGAAEQAVQGGTTAAEEEDEDEDGQDEGQSD